LTSLAEQLQFLVSEQPASRMKLPFRLLWIFTSLTLSRLTVPSAQAQIVPDDTLPSASTVEAGCTDCTIEGGTRQGNNLFHSFREFSVPTGGSAHFNNAADVRNILTRVTGNSVSNIDGLLRSNGTANLFLLNPNGVIFGPNARLDVGGSFLASTADAIEFGNQGFFSAANPEAPVLLTVQPSAFWFNQVARAAIVNRSTVPLETDKQGLPVPDRQGLQVPDGQSLLLLGGNINFAGGGVNAAEGRVELAAVAGTGRVGLSLDDNNLRLRFPAALNRADISLTNGSTVNTSGEGSGSIQIWGRRVFMNGGSQVASFTQGAEPGGRLAVNTSESLSVIGAVAYGNLSTVTFGDGKAGDLLIETRRLSLRNGGSVASGTFGNGFAGQLTVNATESVEIAGRDGLASSGLFSSTASAGQGANLTVNTRRLILQDGGGLSASALLASQDGQIFPVSGDGGDLTINASDSVELSRQGLILTTTVGSGNAGNITINTGRLLVQDESLIAANASAANDAQLGNAGNVVVRAQSITLRNQSRINAITTKNQGGNITLQVQDLLLLQQLSSISTTAGTDQAGGDGGNITIDSNFLVAIPNENSDISANAFTGQGGRVEITAQSILGIQDRSQPTSLSDITASSEFGSAGTISLNTPDVDLNRGLTELPETVVDASQLVALGCTPAATRQVNQGEFYQTGRGGIAPLPTDPQSSSDILEDLQPPNSWNETTVANTPIQEAQGWQVNDHGQVVLLAERPDQLQHCGR
jgi:filamentous hemagglutinin family protein